MGWAIGTGENGRDIGYAVPAICDHPDCNEEIDRGFSYCCGEYTTDEGCGLYFCGSHLMTVENPLTDEEDDNAYSPQLCDACALYWKLRQIDDEVAWELAPKGYEPKPDALKWVYWKLHDMSWDEWRKNNPEATEAMEERLAAEADDAALEALDQELTPQMEQNEEKF